MRAIQDGIIVLEILVFIDDLNPVLVLLFCRLLPDVCEMAIDSHDGWGGGMSVVRTRSVLLSNRR